MLKKVTVLMPVYNSEKYLKESIDSILNQTYENFELLILDDASTDNSVKIINSYKDDRIKLFKNEKNKGISYTRNKGVELATGEFIALMDSDDISKKNRLEVEVKFLEKYTEFDVVSSRAEVLNGEKLYKTHKKIEEFELANIQLMFRDVIINPASMFRKEFINKNNIRYREENFVAEDYDFWVECAKFTNIAILSEALLIYRTGHKNTSSLSLKNNYIERKNLIDKIRVQCLNNNGIYLKEEEYLLFNKIFSDPIMKIHIDDIYQYKKILNKFIDIDGYDKTLVSDSVKKMLISKILELDCNKLKKLYLVNFKLKKESIISYIKSIIKVIILG